MLSLPQGDHEITNRPGYDQGLCPGGSVNGSSKYGGIIRKPGNEAAGANGAGLIPIFGGGAMRGGTTGGGTGIRDGTCGSCRLIISQIGRKSRRGPRPPQWL